MVMNVIITTVIRGDGPEKDEEPVMMKGDNMSAVFWVQQCHEGEGSNEGERVDEADEVVGGSE